jgi:uncharacterized Ntn-hydrolase superfamily protein
VTFSIVGRCARTGALGVAVTSSSPAVASRCAHVRAGVGAATTQNVTDPHLGPALLDSLEQGADAVAALGTVRANAAYIEHRQLSVVDGSGLVASWSGNATLGIHGAVDGASAVATGNMLAAPSVLEAVIAAFEQEPEAMLEVRLLAGLTAGLSAGGELGPLHSAGLAVCEQVRWPVTDLRVDWSGAPIADLQDLWKLWAPQKADYVLRALDPTRAPGYSVPGGDR